MQKKTMNIIGVSNTVTLYVSLRTVHLSLFFCFFRLRKETSDYIVRKKSTITRSAVCSPFHFSSNQQENKFHSILMLVVYEVSFTQVRINASMM